MLGRAVATLSLAVLHVSSLPAERPLRPLAERAVAQDYGEVLAAINAEAPQSHCHNRKSKLSFVSYKHYVLPILDASRGIFF